MTVRTLATKSAALTLMAMTIAGTAPAQAENEKSVAAQTSEAAGEIADTAYAIGETTTDTAQAGVDALGDVAKKAYGGASNISAQLDAALTGDTVIRSSDGEILGTVYKTDMDGDRVIIDLDGEMEGADTRAIENAAVRASSLSVLEDGEVMLDMTSEQFAQALRTSPEVQFGD